MAVKFIQLGLGGWGLNWAQYVSGTVAEAEPVAFVEQSAEARALAISQAGLPEDKIYPDLATAGAAVEADAVLAIVPLGVHAPVASDALERGYHVLVEKPFTPTVEDAVEVVALAASRERLLMVNQNYRWFPAPQLARELVQNNEIGEVVSVALDFHRYYGPAYRYFFLEQPLLSDMAIHHFDLMRFVLGDDAESVSCLSWNEPGSPFSGNPAAAATIRFKRGTIVSYRGSWLSRGNGTAWAGNWRLDGTKGSISFSSRSAGPLELGADYVTLFQEGKSERSLPLPVLDHVDRGGALQGFARAIMSGDISPASAPGHDNLKSLALSEAASRSALAEGTTVTLRDILKEPL